MKTLKLKYGEYYSLKVTDSSKNVINNVEIIGCQITSEQHLFTVPTYSNTEKDKDRIADLMRGESRLQVLKAKKDAGENLTTEEEKELKELESEFFSWTYNRIDKTDDFINKTVLLTVNPTTPERELEISKHELKCEIQVLEKTRIKKRVEVPVIVRLPIRFFGNIIGYWNKKIGVRHEWVNTDEWNTGGTQGDGRLRKK